MNPCLSTAIKFRDGFRVGQYFTPSQLKLLLGHFLGLKIPSNNFVSSPSEYTAQKRTEYLPDLNNRVCYYRRGIKYARSII